MGLIKTAIIFFLSSFAGQIAGYGSPPPPPPPPCNTPQCQSGTFCYSNTNVCTPCPPGYRYISNPNIGVSSTELWGCTICPEGTYSNSKNSAECIQCPLGTFSSEKGSTSFTSCLSNEYNDKIGQTSCSICSTCSLGKYKINECNLKKNTECVNCKPIENCAVSPSCSSDNDSKCAYCQPNYYLSASSDVCLLSKTCVNNIEYEVSLYTLTTDRVCSTCVNSCNKGTMLTGVCKGTENPKCVPCPDESYKIILDSSPCLPCITKCVAGFELQNICSAISNSLCAPCKEGFYKSLNDGSSCLACSSRCDPGFELNHECLPTTNPVCVPCKEGFYKSLSDESSCLACSSRCDPGFELNHECLPTINPICVPCKKGFYKSLSDGSLCLACFSRCDPGFELNHECLPTINPRCVPCKEEFYKSLSDGSSCLICNNDCGEGAYLDSLCNSVNNPKCMLCPENTANPHKFSVFKDSCIPCNYGSISASGSATCIQCSKGTATFGGNNCIKCLPGTYTDSIGSIDCKLCPSGTFNANTGSTTIDDCIACNHGYYSEIGAYECMACPIGTYENGKHTCVSCPFGTYNNKIGQTECINCDAGTFNNNINSIDVNECYPCLAGTFSKIGYSNCHLCLAGTYSNKIKTEECDINIPGTYTATNGSLNPIKCSPGYYSDTYGAKKCTPCDIGYMNNMVGSIHKNNCSICPIGTYSNMTASTSCYQTIQGYYQDKEGQADMIPCPIGTFNTKIGSTTIQSCELCKVGNYQSERGSTLCHKCAPGFYQNKTGQSECTNCPAGTYNEKEGATNLDFCLQCNSGTYSPQIAATTSSTCIISPVGTFVAQTGLKNYTECEPGFYQNKTGQLKCIACQSGKYNPIIRAVNENNCINATAGYFVNKTGSGTFNHCLAGTSSNITGATYCKECLPGTFSAKNASLQCNLCPINSFTIGTGHSDCDEIGTPFIYLKNVSSTSIDIVIKTNFTALVPIVYDCSDSCEIYINNKLLVKEVDNHIKKLTEQRSKIIVSIKLGIDTIHVNYNGTFNSNIALINDQDWYCVKNNANNYIHQCQGIPKNIVVKTATLITTRDDVYNNIYANPNITFSSTIRLIPDTQEYSFSLINLEPAVKYSFKLLFNIINEISDEISDEISISDINEIKSYKLGTIITEPGIPTGPVQNLVKYFLGITPIEHVLNDQSKLQIHWELPKIIFQHGPIIRYNVSYISKERTHITYGPNARLVVIPSIKKTFFTSLTTIVLSDLNPDTEYTIHVYALTKAIGEGPINTIVLKTQVSAPPNPPALSLISQKSDNIVVGWPTLTNETGIITKVWIISEPYDNTIKTPMIIHIPENKTNIKPLPFPHEGLLGFFDSYNLLNTCESHIFGFNFINVNTKKICGGFCNIICDYGTPMLDPTIIFPTNDKNLTNDNYIMFFNTSNNTVGTRLVPYLTMKKRLDINAVNNNIQFSAGTFLVGDGLNNVKSKLNNTLLNKNLNYRLRFIVFTSETLYSISEPLEIIQIEESRYLAIESLYLALLLGICFILLLLLLFFCFKKYRTSNKTSIINDENHIYINDENKKDTTTNMKNTANTVQTVNNQLYWAQQNKGGDYNVLNNKHYWAQQNKGGDYNVLNNRHYLDVSMNQETPPLYEKENAQNMPQYYNYYNNNNDDYNIINPPALPKKEKEKYTRTDTNTDDNTDDYYLDVSINT